MNKTIEEIIGVDSVSYVFNFGKYYGVKFSYVAKRNPDYLVYIYENYNLDKYLKRLIEKWVID